jgi:hypothetical protein
VRIEDRVTTGIAARGATTDRATTGARGATTDRRATTGAKPRLTMPKHRRPPPEAAESPSPDRAGRIGPTVAVRHARIGGRGATSAARRRQT